MAHSENFSKVFNEVQTGMMGAYPASPISPSKDRYTITFRTFSLQNYPTGDNRVFSIQGTHKFEDVMARINDRYSYAGPLIPLYKNKRDEVITIDSEEVYDKILFDTFGDSLRKEADLKIYIKPLQANIDRNVYNSIVNTGRPSLLQRNNARIVRIWSLIRPTTIR